ncbi:hypothetical protein PMAYCL1PPCAC_23196 [Pristionchus mayeri]|uniref:Uncharacterized protein n=1 Tax=Pristionchus mayeri TaxID=1317129 RepID=A0AAN5CXL5_9BILA|nr:hypothetical protein PMAYCL1PPCAC_23193 [Pristionchus mayeri]GMR53001.1 hypothetical protein PMAYCL1PPCAC_23196 [Pristionchus mayeri]
MGLLKELVEFEEEEFEDLEKKDKEYVQSVKNYVWHKLTIRASLNVIKKKKEEYKRMKMSRTQIEEDIDSKSTEFFKSWYENMSGDQRKIHTKRFNIDEL